MRAEIIATGSEFLIPHKIETNSLYITKKLIEIGIRVGFKTIVGDNREDLYKVIKDASKRTPLIIIIGGLGPTEDDVTREVISKFLKKDLILREGILEKLRKTFKVRGIKMPDNNIRQAFVIEDAVIMENEYGTAPGQFIDNKYLKIAMLPGPPQELKSMVDNHLTKLLSKQKSFIYAFKTISLAGITESEVSDRIRNLILDSKNPWINISAEPGQIKVNIMARDKKSKQKAESIAENIFKKIYDRLKENIFSTEEKELAEIVGEILENRKLKISIAESCTGGLLSSRITDIPGSSKYYDRTVVSYSNCSKNEMLGVRKKTLEKYGAVSKQTAKEMVEGIVKVSGSDCGIAVTGIAGPTGGTEEKPVGLVYIAVLTPEGTRIYKENFTGAREKIKWRSSQQALFYLWKGLKS